MQIQITMLRVGDTQTGPGATGKEDNYQRSRNAS